MSLTFRSIEMLHGYYINILYILQYIPQNEEVLHNVKLHRKHKEKKQKRKVRGR